MEKTTETTGPEWLTKDPHRLEAIQRRWNAATEKTITIEGGPSITIRRPTEEELIAYLDKKAIISTGERVSNDAFQDGDGELLSCVTSPSRTEMEELLEDFPRLNVHLEGAIMALSGGERLIRSANGLIAKEHRTAGKNLIAFVVDTLPRPARDAGEDDEAHTARVAAWEAGERERLIVLRKISRYECKALEHDARTIGRSTPLPSELTKLTRPHVVSLNAEQKARTKAILDEAPMIGFSLGHALWQAAVAAVKAS